MITQLSYEAITTRAMTEILSSYKFELEEKENTEQYIKELYKEIRHDLEKKDLFTVKSKYPTPGNIGDGIHAQGTHRDLSDCIVLNWVLRDKITNLEYQLLKIDRLITISKCFSELPFHERTVLYEYFVKGTPLINFLGIDGTQSLASVYRAKTNAVEHMRILYIDHLREPNHYDYIDKELYRLAQPFYDFVEGTK